MKGGKKKRLLLAFAITSPLLVISIIWTYLTFSFFDPDMRQRLGIPSGPWIDTMKREYLDRIGPYRISAIPYLLFIIGFASLYGLSLWKEKWRRERKEPPRPSKNLLHPLWNRVKSTIPLAIDSFTSSMRWLEKWFDSYRFFIENLIAISLIPLFFFLIHKIKMETNPASLPFGVDWHDWLFSCRAIETGKLWYYSAVRLPLYPAISALLTSFFKDPVEAGQFASMLFGSFVPYAIFLFLRPLFPFYLALLTSFLLITLPSFFSFSISNSGYILFTLTSFLTLAMGLRAIRSRKKVFFVISGLFAGLSLAGILYGFIYIFIVLTSYILTLPENWKGIRDLFKEVLSFLLFPAITGPLLLLLPLDFADLSMQILSGTLDTPYILSTYNPKIPPLDSGRTPLLEFPRLEVILTNFERFPGFFNIHHFIFWLFLMIGLSTLIGSFFTLKGGIIQKISRFFSAEGFVLLSLSPLIIFWRNSILSERFLLTVFPIVLFLIMKGVRDSLNSIIKGKGFARFMRSILFIALFCGISFKCIGFLKNPSLSFKGFDKGIIDSKIAIDLSESIKEMVKDEKDVVIFNYSLEFFTPFLIDQYYIQDISVEETPEKVIERALLKAHQGKSIYIVIDNLDFRRRPSFLRQEGISKFTDPPFKMLFEKEYPAFKDEATGIIRKVMIMKIGSPP